MRVAIVTETFLPKVDGIVRMLTELLGYLADAGHEALVLTPGSGPPAHAGFRVTRFHGLRWKLYPGLTVARPSPRLLAILAGWRPDIVHLAGPVLLGAQAAVAGRMLGLPLAAHFQTDLAAYAGHHGLRPLGPLAWHYLRAVHALADRTYCPTPTVRRQLAARGFRDLALCARGVDTAGFGPARRDPALRRRLLGGGAEQAAPLLAYVGRLSPEKNLGALVTIAAARPDLPLLIVGDGPARPGLERALAATPARAHFTGELRGAALAAAYASADLFVCTSLTETYCQVAQEAMASGLPVLGFRAGGVQDVIAHGETGLLCPPGDDRAWLAALAALAGDPARRRRYAATARAVAEGRTWTALFDRLLGEYREIAHARRTRAWSSRWAGQWLGQ
jgi:phosphatidylinositol alpha 1,6-mannosyltransferase